MEKPIFPTKYIRITQGYSEGTHKDSYAIDNAGKDGGIDNIYAPFSGIIKKIYQNDANEVWLESIDKVEYPDGTIDYMTVMFAHADNVDHLFVGKRINQKEIFYKEGTKGNTTGNHCHIECGKGKFSGTGWHKNSAGYWSIDNAKKPEECFWLDADNEIKDTKGYKFKKISTESVEKENISTTNNYSTNNVTTHTANETAAKYKEFVAPETNLYGIYLQKEQKVLIEKLT